VFSETHTRGVGCLELTAWQGNFGHGFLDRGLNTRLGIQALTEYFQGVLDEPAARVFLLNQRHTAQIVSVLDAKSLDELCREGPGRREADGWLVDFSKIASQRFVFGIKTADCFPVLVRTRNSPLGAALHCGWRGTLSGILPKLLGRLSESGVSMEEVEIAVGPGAQVCCYEIGEELAARFSLFSEQELGDFSGSCSAVENRRGKLYGNIPELLRAQARVRGVPEPRFFQVKHCSICNPSFFSFRREKDLCGRQLSFVAGPLSTSKR